MERAFRILKWGVILPARYLMGQLAGQFYDYKWGEFEGMETKYRFPFQLFSSISLIHLIIALISTFLPGIAWLVCVSSSVMSMTSAGLALLVIKKYVNSGE